MHSRSQIGAVGAVILALACLTGTPFIFKAAAQEEAGQEEAGKDAEIKALEERIEKLEARFAEMEKRLAPLLAQTTVTEAKGAVRDQARARMRKDLEKHSQDEIREAEQLYQVANKNWRSPEAKESLAKMVEKFPDLNRTGCAILYLGQMSEGDERVKLLQTAIDKHGDCFYGNGVQVGAYARFLLGLYHKDAGEAEKAKSLFDQIRSDFPGAIDHRGRSLAEQLPRE